MSDVQSKKRKSLSDELDETSRFTINVGGTIFQVDSNTINQYPDTMLASMLSKRWNENKTDKEVFLDRDPVLFRYILNFYRTGKMAIPHTITKAEMFDEIEYFTLPLEKKNIQYDTESISGMRTATIDFDNAYVDGLKKKQRKSAIEACINGLAAILIEKLQSSPRREQVSLSLGYHGRIDDEIVMAMRHFVDDAVCEAVKSIVEKAGYFLRIDNERDFIISRKPFLPDV